MHKGTHAVPDHDAENMLHLVSAIACSLVNNPNSVVVEISEEQDRTVLRLRVAPKDVGQVVGKQGRIARSLRTILSAASMKLKRRFNLEIME